MTEKTDDLVKRLRRVSMDLGIPSTTTLDSKVVAHAADRIEALEAKLAKAVRGLDWIGRRSILIEAGAPSLRLHARMILANLTGGKDD